ncbi:MAG: hypothetical protein AAFX87_08735 [Bacteroidota bacterium]
MFLFGARAVVHGQDIDLDSVDLEALDRELLEFGVDSLELIALIDSLIALEDLRYSELNVRFGYVSSVVNAGRELIKQYGFTPGVSYYHNSGAFVDLAGFWNSESNPHYNLTVLTLGYAGEISPKWSYTTSYDHSFYADGGVIAQPGFSIDTIAFEFDEDFITTFSNPLNNTLTLSNFFDFNHLNLGLDYSYLFGQESAHRVQASVSGYFTIKDVGFIDRITFLPSASVLFGNQDVIYSRYNFDNYEFEDYQELLEQSENRDLFGRLLLENLADARRGNDRITREIRRQVTLNTFVELLDILSAQTDERNEFGLMNYSLSAPISFRINNFNIYTSYTYNIPVELPGEQFELSPSGFFSVTLSYSIPFGKL